MPPAMVVGSRDGEPNLDASFQELVKAIEKANPSERELYDIFAPVRKRMWRKTLTKWLLGVVCLAAICSTVQYVPTVNWHVTAVGRLVMIQLLPYWDWTPLYREKCLISKSTGSTAPKKYDVSFSFPDDCIVCQNLGTVPVRENVTYETMFRHHLMRNVPIVVSDANSPWMEHARFGRDWNSYLAAVEELLLSNPCDFRTNLLFNPGSAKASTVARMVDLLDDHHSATNDTNQRGWFVQFRNCVLRTKKKTRTLFGKPYFYATHWEPPYTSWILMSRDFPNATEVEPNMAGLVIVRQMRSRLSVVLRARAECAAICRTHSITLRERQSLVFSTTLWNFSYLPTDTNVTSVTFVTESYESV